jgi:P-type Ca2+ transporter type 2C
VAFEWFQALNARSQYQSILAIGPFSNRWLLAGVGIAIVLQVAVIHTPIGHLLFDTVPLSLFDWALIVLVSSSIWIADEVFKRLGLHGRQPATRPPA